MESTHNKKETKCECCGFKRSRNSRSNKKSCGIEKKKALTVKDANTFLTKQIEEIENEIMELLEKGCECNDHT